jgi:hypothetical protein
MPALKAEVGDLPVATSPDHAKPRLPEKPAPSLAQVREVAPKEETGHALRNSGRRSVPQASA